MAYNVYCFAYNTEHFIVQLLTKVWNPGVRSESVSMHHLQRC